MSAYRPHTAQCPAEDTTGYSAPCLCGAENYNAGLDNIKEHMDAIWVAVSGHPKGREAWQAATELEALAKKGLSTP